MEEQRHEEQLPGVALEVANSDAFRSKAMNEGCSRETRESSVTHEEVRST